MLLMLPAALKACSCGGIPSAAACSRMVSRRRCSGSPSRGTPCTPAAASISEAQRLPALYCGEGGRTYLPQLEVRVACDLLRAGAEHAEHKQQGSHHHARHLAARPLRSSLLAALLVQAAQPLARPRRDELRQKQKKCEMLLGQGASHKYTVKILSRAAATRRGLLASSHTNRQQNLYTRSGAL